MQCEAILSGYSNSKSVYYLLAKKHTYDVLRLHCEKLNMPFLWCTFYHPVGKFNKPEQIIIKTINSLRNGEIPRFGPADKWFDVIAAEDLAHGFYLAGNSDLIGDRYFIGSGSPRLLKDYLTEIVDIVGGDARIDIGYYPDDGLPMRREWLDDSIFCEETGFRAEIGFEEYLRDQIK